MDTRFWGPSGWKLLHSLAYSYEPTQKNRENMQNFLQTLPFILPCKFCRASLTDYFKQHPYEPDALKSNESMVKWMYKIHNCVNDKLRNQGLNPTKNPTFEATNTMYVKWLSLPWIHHLTSYWDFLFAVAYNHPTESTRNSTPMPECPPDAKKCKDIFEKNKWNVLDKKTRITWFKKFWYYLPVVLPKHIQIKWIEAVKLTRPNLKNRRTTLAWLWRMRCYLDPKFKDPYTSICKKISEFSSDCSYNKTAKTCRKTKKITMKSKTRKISKS